MKEVIIFGCKDLAQLAKFYLENDSAYKDSYKVVAFTVHREFLSDTTFEGLPVVAFEDLDQQYPPSQYSLFAPMTGKSMNAVRRSVFEQGKKRGYSFISYISSKATNFSKSVGENCFIFEDNTIQPFVKIGNNVVLWSGNHIGHHSVIEDDVFFTSHIVLSGHCHVGRGSWVGVNSTIRDFTNIAPMTLIAMGAMITKDTEEQGFYLGAPAKKQNKLSTEVM